MSATPLLQRAPRIRRAPYHLLAAACVAALAACGGGTDGPGAPTTPPPPTATLALTAAPTIVTVEQGKSVAATVNIVRGGPASPVSLAAGLAGGVTGVAATLAPATLMPDRTESVVTFTTTAATPAGDHAVTITGGGGGANASTTIVLRVTPAVIPPQPQLDDLSGVALDASGQPLANVIVQVKMVWNPNVVRTRTGAGGRYTVRGLPAGLSHQVLAWHEVQYAGRSHCVRLGMPNTGDYDAFVPGAGVVRDFRWKLTGRIPDAGNNYFGATLVLVPATNFYDPVLQDGDDVEITLAPQGPLVDGSPGAVITRTVRYNSTGWNSRLDDIPHGVYAARATRVRGGVRTALRVARLESGTPAATATVEWEPDHPGSCGQVLGPDLRAFSVRLENP